MAPLATRNRTLRVEERTCVVCDHVFSVLVGDGSGRTDRNRTICSPACRRERANDWKIRTRREYSPTQTTRSCRLCGKPFVVLKGRGAGSGNGSRKKVFCSKQCCLSARRARDITTNERARTERSCEMCRSTFVPAKRRDQRFCSHPCRVRSVHILRRYQMTPEDYWLRWNRQGGACPCGRPLEGRIAVDHCHTTGRVRGLMHNECNTAIGQVRDDPQTLRLLAAYLEGE